MRITRRDLARPLRARWKARPRGRRLAMLAAAVAVPAFAAQPDWQVQGDSSRSVEAMPFETAGHSFPGSAFYYLSDTPELTAPGLPPIRTDDGHADGGALVPARPFLAHGSATDMARALECLTMAIYYEAASESDAGQRAVAQVVMNRVAHPTYPSTVCGVVFQGSARSTGCQFTFTCDGSLARRPERQAWIRARSVAQRVLGGTVYAPIGLATHYHTIQVHPYWAGSLDRVGVIGAHIFYRWRGAAGQPGAFRAAYEGNEPSSSTLAAERTRTADPADPVTLARVYEQSLTQQALPGQPALAPAYAPAYADAVEANGGERNYQARNLPQSGTVRAEYAQSGQWLAGMR